VRADLQPYKHTNRVRAKSVENLYTLIKTAQKVSLWILFITESALQFSVAPPA